MKKTFIIIISLICALTILLSPSMLNAKYVAEFTQNLSLSAGNNKYVLRLDANGGHFTDTGLTVKTVKSTTTSFSHYDNVEYENISGSNTYVFIGWSTTKTGSAVEFKKGQNITVANEGTTTLYAVWGISFSDFKTNYKESISGLVGGYSPGRLDKVEKTPIEPTVSADGSVFHLNMSNMTGGLYERIFIPFDLEPDAIYEIYFEFKGTGKYTYYKVDDKVSGLFGWDVIDQETFNLLHERSNGTTTNPTDNSERSVSEIYTAHYSGSALQKKLNLSKDDAYAQFKNGVNKFVDSASRVDYDFNIKPLAYHDIIYTDEYADEAKVTKYLYIEFSNVYDQIASGTNKKTAYHQLYNFSFKRIDDDNFPTDTLTSIGGSTTIKRFNLDNILITDKSGASADKEVQLNITGNDWWNRPEHKLELDMKTIQLSGKNVNRVPAGEYAYQRVAGDLQPTTNTNNSSVIWYGWVADTVARNCTVENCGCKHTAGYHVGGVCGYQIDDNEPEYREDWFVYAADASDILDTAKNLGGNAGTRVNMKIRFTRYMDRGAHNVRILYKQADGTVVLLDECIITTYETKAADLPAFEAYPDKTNTVKRANYDAISLYSSTSTTALNEFFTNGDDGYKAWNKVAYADSTKNPNATHIGVRGWVLDDYDDNFGTFGYSIDNNAPVFDSSFRGTAESAVIGQMNSAGAKSCARINVYVPLDAMPDTGVYNVRIVYRTHDKTRVITISEFKLHRVTRTIQTVEIE